MSNSWKRKKTNLYVTHKTRNSGHVGDLTAVAKSIISNEHATNKNNLRELLAEPKINRYIKYHIANQSKQEAKLNIKEHSKTIYNRISYQQEEEASH